MADPPALVPSQLRMAVQRLSRRLRQQSSAEITASQISAMSTLDRHGSLTLGELAAIERVAPPSMTRIAARLEERQLVARTVDANDRRVARVAITEVGKQVLEESRTRRDAYLAERLVGLTEEEQQVLARAIGLLERLAHDER